MAVIALENAALHAGAGAEQGREVTTAKHKYHYHLYDNASLSSYLPHLGNPTLSLQFSRNLYHKVDLLCSQISAQ